MTDYKTQLMNKKLTCEKYLLCPCGSKLKLDQVRRHDKRNIYRHFKSNKHIYKHLQNPEIFNELKFEYEEEKKIDDRYFIDYIKENINSMEIKDIVYHLLTKYTLDDIKFLFITILKFELKNNFEIYPLFKIY